LGAIPIDFRKVPLWNRYWATKGVGADMLECVGYQCCDKHGTEHITMNELVQAVKATGSIELLSFVPEDPKSKKNCRKRTHGFWLCQFWMKGQRIATGQANIKAYNRQLSTLLVGSEAIFNCLAWTFIKRGSWCLQTLWCPWKGWTKIILKP
jgi:threonine dehydrogenase-like Zn-dependent dehydrogenase